jgi:4-diphosphocytidyl-2-C-methyl-D-erythritol kinase
MEPGVQRFAPAKVNLFLHVGERHASGYHDLLSLAVFADIGDMVSVTRADRLTLTLSGPNCVGLDAGPSNLVLRAAAALQEWSLARGQAVGGASLTLHKALPVASGIGGGSSDAAATLLLLTRHWGLVISDEDLFRIGRSLGADVPLCLRGAPSIMSGEGEQLAPAPDLPDFSMVLVNPGVELSTAAVFACLQVRSGARAPASPDRFKTPRELAAWLDRATNDLAAPARRLAPAIMRVEQALVATENCLLSRMSGSGATCFGMYPGIESAEAAASVLRAAHPDWWIASCGLLAPQ